MYNLDLKNKVSTVGTSGFTLLQPNSERRYLLIQNASETATIQVSFDSSISIANGVVIPPLGAYEPLVAPTGIVATQSDEANTQVVTVEG